MDGKTAGERKNELAAMGARLMVAVLGELRAYPPAAQAEDGVTYAPKIDKSEAQLDFSQDAATVERQVRAFNPPGAWFEHADERVRVLSAEVADRGGDPGEVLDDRLTIGCASGAIRPLLVQRAGRGVMAPDELLRGFPLPVGTRL
jgi:methionyl-tRNA formyltransferase